jgi:diguanylate cyclase (GGDEF)-like protein
MNAKNNPAGHSRYLWLTLSAFVLFLVTFVLYLQAVRDRDRASESRRRSFLIAEALRQSSNDLTRIARAYVVTGDPAYRQQFDKVLDSRDGKTASIAGYQNIYWELLQPVARRYCPDCRAIPFVKAIREAGFTEEEFEDLKSAKDQSDMLAATEYAAMELADPAYAPDITRRSQAITMLHDAAYNKAKANIMGAIGAFNRKADARTRAAVYSAESYADKLRMVFVIFCVLLLSLLAAMRIRIASILGGSVQELHARIARLGSGDFSASIPVQKGKESSILGWLSETQANLARIDARRKEAEARIRYLAHFDVLTGLPNRLQLQERATRAFGRARQEGQPLALMLLDLDLFKDINDTLGHGVGDALLVDLARRLRALGGKGDTVARVGGDEFIFLLFGVSEERAASAAQRILDVIAAPYQVEHHELNVSGSIGIAMYPFHGGDFELLSRRADAAMYQIKREGRHGYTFYSMQLEAHKVRGLKITGALRQALARGQFRLVYQPQVSARDGSLVGAEALIRWTHPELGEVPPTEFIPIAEDSGLITSIGEWVLRTAVRQACIWMRSGLPPAVIAVNLSAIQFRHPGFPSQVTTILEEEGLPAEYLELELTESVAMRDPGGAIAIMDALHERGVRMSIDDFGTGYSSLNHLKKFKVYKLKIDRSFVRDICTDVDDRAIVGAVTHMAGSLGLLTIAEGVETPEQLDILKAQGCDELQGYLVSKPLSADQFEAMVRAGALGPCKARGWGTQP